MTARAHLTKRELAKALTCGLNEVYAVADSKGIPYDERYGVRANGEPYTYRRYNRVEVFACLDERGRLGARRAAS